jgi:hypothetical protein
MEVPLFLDLMRPFYLTIFHELTTDLTLQGKDFLRGAQIWFFIFMVSFQEHHIYEEKITHTHTHGHIIFIDSCTNLL